MRTSKLFAITLIWICMICVGCEMNTSQSKEGVANMGDLYMATTTSTADTGLLDYLTILFKEDTGYNLKYDAVGTGAALTLGKNGDVDIVLVHAKESEEEFVANGYGVERNEVMYNDFIVVGPTDVEANNDVELLFTKLWEEDFVFTSRGDDSGTDQREKSIWSTLGLDPTENPNYYELGQGMGKTITIANEMMAYCLTDRGTWLKMSMDSEVEMSIDILCEGDDVLLNQYSVIAINPEVYADTNIKGATAFIEWICSDEIQQLIGEFGVEEYGESLFIPNANRS